MKASLWDNPILGGGARLAGYIRNNAPAQMIRSAGQELAKGRQLLIFPEGTRTVREPINSFKGGFSLIAKMSGVPVQTVFIEANSPFLSKGWPILKKPPFPIIYKLRLGEKFEIGKDETTKEFVARLECYYEGELQHPASDTNELPSTDDHFIHSPDPHPELQHRG